MKTIFLKRIKQILKYFVYSIAFVVGILSLKKIRQLFYKDEDSIDNQINKLKEKEVDAKDFYCVPRRVNVVAIKSMLGKIKRSNGQRNGRSKGDHK